MSQWKLLFRIFFTGKRLWHQLITKILKEIPILRWQGMNSRNNAFVMLCTAILYVDFGASGMSLIIKHWRVRRFHFVIFYKFSWPLYIWLLAHLWNWLLSFLEVFMFKLAFWSYICMLSFYPSLWCTKAAMSFQKTFTCQKIPLQFIHPQMILGCFSMTFRLLKTQWSGSHNWDGTLV